MFVVIFLIKLLLLLLLSCHHGRWEPSACCGGGGACCGGRCTVSLSPSPSSALSPPHRQLCRRRCRHRHLLDLVVALVVRRRTNNQTTVPKESGFSRSVKVPSSFYDSTDEKKWIFNRKQKWEVWIFEIKTGKLVDTFGLPIGAKGDSWMNLGGRVKRGINRVYFLSSEWVLGGRLPDFVIIFVLLTKKTSSSEKL